MLSFSGSLKVFVALEACDMRKGFNGLYGLVTQRLGEDPNLTFADFEQNENFSGRELWFLWGF